MKTVIIIFHLTIYSFNMMAQDEHICSAKGSTPLKQRYKLYSTSGDQNIDIVTIRELTLLQNAFLVYPVLYFYDDIDGKNAQASDEVTSPKGIDGTVIFGKRLFKSEFIKTFGGTTIPIIIAHEYAHIVDFKFGALENVPKKQREIFADVFAGMYMYVRAMNGLYTDINAVINSFKSMGDTKFGENDHGTPEERAEAVLHGYTFMMTNAQNGVYVNLNQAKEEAIEYSKQFGDEDED